MAVSSSCKWEVRGTGNDANGGGFVTGATGSDFSLQDSPQYALTGIATAGAGAVFLSASAASNMVGNILQVVSGTNFTAGFYEVLSVSVGVSVTVDRNLCTGVGASGVINIGGALATIQVGMTNCTAQGMVVYVKSATYALSAALTTPSQSGSNFYTRVIGYTSTRSDQGKPTLTVASTINAITVSQLGWKFENFILSGSSGALIGVSSSQSYCDLYNVTISGFARGVSFAAECGLFHCDISGATATAAVSLAARSIVSSCYIHDNSIVGINLSGGSANIVNSVIANNTGASSDGINMNTETGSSVTGCVIYGNGRDGLRGGINYSFAMGGNIQNNIFAKNAGYGINWTAVGPTSNPPWVNYNGFWSNGSGAMNNLSTGLQNVLITGTDPTNDPFTAKGSGDFSLNATSGAGALLRAAGFPGVIGSSTGYKDIGTFQHQDSGGSSGITRNPDLS